MYSLGISGAETDYGALFQVSKLLNILKGHLGKAHQILKGERTPFEELPSDSDSDADISSQLDARGLSMDEDSPWEVSLDSTEFPLYERLQGNTRYDQSPGQTSPKISAQLPSKETIEKKPQINTELEQLLDSIKTYCDLSLQASPSKTSNDRSA